MSILQEIYDETAAQYRAADEIHLQGDDYQRVRATLLRLGAAWDRPIDALDLGCGAGRYFHCLPNARRLVGVDISQKMLDAARNPVRRDAITAREIELICSDLMALRLPRQSLDLIYCIGVFGNGCDATPRLLSNLRSWLRPGGRFFFDCFAEETFPAKIAQRKKLKAAIYSRLTPRLRRAWDKRSGWPPLFLTTPAQLRARLLAARFDVEALGTVEALSPLGKVRKIECVARVAPG